MELYLMQHGACMSKEQDPEQPLTEEGFAQIQATGRALQVLGVRLDVMVCSSKVRSRQSAALVAEALGLPGDRIIETDRVKPMAPVEQTIEFLQQFADEKAIFIAGHLPSLANIATFLLTEGEGAAIAFQQGGVVKIDLEALPARNGVLQWYLTPAQLRLLDKS